MLLFIIWPYMLFPRFCTVSFERIYIYLSYNWVVISARKTLKALTIFNRERVSQASSGQSESCRNLQTAGTSANQDSETATNKGASQPVWAALGTHEVEKSRRQSFSSKGQNSMGLTWPAFNYRLLRFKNKVFFLLFRWRDTLQ